MSEIEEKIQRTKKWNEANPPRLEYSPEEIQQMLTDIDQVVSACKAEAQGIAPADMIKTVRGGKVVWITRDQMNRILAEKRRVSGTKYVQRSIRGEDSISSEVNHRARVCKALVDSIRKAAPDEIPDLTRKLRDLDIVLNRSLGLGKEIQTLELAIERKKSEDPILREMDRASSEMLAAIDKQDLDGAEICKTYSDRHAEEYLVKQKRLEPYLNKAKECRTQFLEEKSKMYQVEMEILVRGEEILSKQMQELLYHDKEGNTVRNLLSQAEQIRAVLTEAQPAFEELRGLSVEGLEQDSAIFQRLDKRFLTPLFLRTTEFASAFQQAWAYFVEGKGTPDGRRKVLEMKPEEEAAPAPSRMVFREDAESRGE